MHNTPTMRRHIHSSYTHERLYPLTRTISYCTLLSILAAPSVVLAFCLKRRTGSYASVTYIWTHIAFCSLRRKSSSTNASIHSFGIAYLSRTTLPLIEAKDYLSRPVVTRCHLGTQQAAQHKMNTKFEFMQDCLTSGRRIFQPRLNFGSTIRCYDDPLAW